MIWATLAVALLTTCALAADPGIDLPNDTTANSTVRFFSQVSDQKKGSVLVYNLYSSSSSSASSQNARISLTNTNSASGIAVHLFFVDGTSCSVADSFICLTANQTATFLASDVDPGVTGYIMAFATDLNGLPVAFDWLIGDEYVKLSTGYVANLGAEAVSVSVLPLLVFTSQGGSVATMIFDGVCYNRLPRVLADDSVLSTQDGNNTLLVVNRIGGSLFTNAGQLGTIFGVLYDDSESAYSFSFGGTCQAINTLTDSFPRVVPRFPTVVPAGRTGWLKLWSATPVDNTGLPGGSTTDTRAILGAALTRNSGASPGAFNGGHNLHKLTLNPISFVQLPIFPPNCG